MPELSLIENFISAQEPWPENVKLYQPYEVEQILLPDNASCLSVKAFLNMCKLPYDVEMRWNAEFMSPTGRVPFIQCGAFVVAELEPIVNFCQGKGISLCSKLSADEKSDLKAFMSLISNVLVNAELYVSWLDEETYSTVTKVRNGSVYPWPLGWLQTSTKRRQVEKLLAALHWRERSMDQVIHDVELCCSALSQRLGDKEYFFGVPFSDKRIELVYTDDGNIQCTANVDKGVHPITFHKVESETKVTDDESMGAVKQEATDVINLPKKGVNCAKPISTRYKEDLECLEKSKSDEDYPIKGILVQSPNVSPGKIKTTEKFIIKPQKESIVLYSNNKDSSNNVSTIYDRIDRGPVSKEYNIDNVAEKKSNPNRFAGEYLEVASKSKSEDLSQNSLDAVLADDVKDSDVRMFSSSTAVDETSESDILSVKDILKQNIAWLDTQKNINSKVNTYLTNTSNQRKKPGLKSNKQNVVFGDVDADVTKGKIFNSSGIFENDFFDTDLSEISMIRGSESSVAQMEQDDRRTYTITDRSDKSTEEGDSHLTITGSQNQSDRITSKDIIMNFEPKIQDCGDEKSLSNEYDIDVDLFQNIFDVVGRRGKSGESLNLNGINALDCPTELDALVFGHVFTIITTRLPCSRLADAVRKHPALVALAKRVDERYFKRP